MGDDSRPVPTTFGKYRVVKDLGQGGMAQVFLASLDGPDGFSKTCVVKRILPELSRDPAFTQMFVSEAKVAAMLSHPNIVQAFEFGIAEEHYYLAMEYVPGASLDQLFRVSRNVFPLGPRVAVEVGMQVARALSYAHSFTLPDGMPLGLIHRDISPDNVLISRDGVVKLADFGVVKSAVNTNATVTGVVKGKYSYMSPEQVTNHAMDQRSDLFSLGILLYEVATGRRLFKGDSLATTVAAVAAAEVPAPSQLMAGFPPVLEQIILKTLARDANDRYQTASQLAAELETFRTSQGWPGGGRHLAKVLNTLFPRAVSGVLPAVSGPGSNPSMPSVGVATPAGKLSSLPPPVPSAPVPSPSPSDQLPPPRPSLPPPARMVAVPAPVAAPFEERSELTNIDIIETPPASEGAMSPLLLGAIGFAVVITALTAWLIVSG